MSGSSILPGSFRPASRIGPSIVLGLILVFLFSAIAGLAPSAGAAPAAADDSSPPGDSPGTQLKAVIIVGPTHDLTSAHLQRGEALAQLAESYGMDVRRVFHPNATWANVLNHIQGANLVAYFGHGNGWPSPYGPFQEKTKNGFGLNPFEGAGRNKVEYYGANKIRRNITLAPSAVVLLNHLCYAPGNGEPGMAIPSWSVAHQRVDNFAAGFLFTGARAVFAYYSQSVATVVQQLATTDKTIAEIFTTRGSQARSAFGYVGWNPRQLDSLRTPGTVNFLDPGSGSEGFQRAVSGDMGMTAAEWRSSTPGGGTGGSGGTGTSGPDTTPPSVPTGLKAEAMGYRRINLSWNASTDDRPGTIRYRIFRNGTKIATVTTTSYVDRPASAGTYRYKIRAVDEARNRSAFSEVVRGQAIRGPL